MAWLTKSRFMAGLQCSKRLWFEVHEPLEPPPEPGLPLLQGRAFDELVQQLAPGQVISRQAGMPAAIAATHAALKAGKANVLYQPAFRSGDLAIVADILRRRADGFELVEVKSSTQVKKEHVPDAAYQTLVLRQAGLPVTSVRIGHVDNRFVLKRAGDYAGIAVEEDITPQVESMLQATADFASDQLEILALSEAPVRAMGEQCHEPYDCPFISRCSALRAAPPDYPVALLPRSASLAHALEAEGFIDLRSVPRERLSSDLHRRIHDATTSGKPYFDAAPTAELRAFGFPRAYLDFETIGLSVPVVEGTRPYEAWPFQWSLRVETAPGEIAHYEHLDIGSFGDFDALAAALIAAAPGSGPVFAYSSSFERGVLERLAERLPDRAERLLDLADRLYDLRPVTQHAYYHRDMRGSWSLKSVLPTLDASLAYESLDDVREGEAAQLAFLQLRDAATSAGRRAQLERSLLEYCGRDTWALVILRRFLCGEPLAGVSAPNAGA